MAIEKPSDLEPGQAGYRVNTPPIPHPSALGDLYAACKKAADQFAVMLELCPDEVYPNMLSEITTRRDECAAAIRKAGGVA